MSLRCPKSTYILSPLTSRSALNRITDWVLGNQANSAYGKNMTSIVLIAVTVVAQYSREEREI
jgi:hypothetical protein